ncbi:hypothetical protein HZS_1117 [Henneguya salminicola]|nr:hypothetical protein HZS_1117 [Henneguya salminicola]
MIYTELFSVKRNHYSHYQKDLVFYFHFNQCRWRKIQSNIHVLQQYNGDEEFKLNLKFVPARAFVPTDDIIQAYKEVISQQFVEQNYDLVS